MDKTFLVDLVKKPDAALRGIRAPCLRPFYQVIFINQLLEESELPLSLVFAGAVIFLPSGEELFALPLLPDLAVFELFLAPA